MATFYLKSGSGAAEFAQSTAYVQGDKIVPKRSDTAGNYLVGRKWVWECTTAGTSAAAEPTWPAAAAQDVTTLTSGTATFTARKPGFSSGTTADWTFATIYIDYIISGLSVGDTLYVSNNHAETVAAAISIAGPAGVTRVICVSDSAAPPTALATTATITSTGNSTITFNANGRAGHYCYGVNFIAGSGASGTASVDVRGHFEECSFQLASTGASSVITIGGVGGVWKNCDVKFAAAGQSISTGQYLNWTGGALLSGGTSPTTLCTSPGIAFISGIDLSNASAAINLVTNTSLGLVAFFANIKLPASWSGAVNSSAPAAGPISHTTHQVTLFNGDNSGTNYALNSKQPYGAVTHETTLVRSGGFDVSWKAVATASAGEPHSFVIFPRISAYNATTGASVTVTVDVLTDSATNLTDRDASIEVEYLGDLGAPLAANTSSYPGPLATASDLTASSATWTTTGMSNPNEQKLTVTFTPQLAGFIHATVKVYKASATVYVDPVLQIS